MMKGLREPGGAGLRNLRLLIQFDGTDFCGWQAQASVRTVQGVLGEALSRLLQGEKVTLYSSSRTDAGVHAIAMPVSFWTRSNLPLKAFVMGLNSLLPADLRVLEAQDAEPSFHARFSTLSKTYLYRIQNGRVALPLQRRTSWHVKAPLDVEAMREAASYLYGRHDFSAFRASGCDADSPVRTVIRCEVDTEAPGLVTVIVAADGFLRNMVRIVVGTLVVVGCGKRPPSWVREVLDNRDRRLAGPTAPAKGLALLSVEYPDFPNDRVFRAS